jgi:hypothetical protein
MSFSMSGVAGSYLTRTAGLTANVTAFTIFLWVKRKANYTGAKYLTTIRSTDESSGHDLTVNDSNFAANSPCLFGNYGTTCGPWDTALPLEGWTCIAVVGSGANLSFKVWDGSAWDTYTVGQTNFTPGKWRIGDDGYGTGPMQALFAHIRLFSAALSDAQLTAERLSATAVLTGSCVSAHSGTGLIAAALTGEIGSAFTNGGGVTIDADNPTVSTFTGITISGTAVMPHEIPIPTGDRYNYCLWSLDFSNAVWVKQTNELITGAAAPPTNWGSSQRIRIKTNVGGIYQVIANVPAGAATMGCVFRRVDTDLLVFKHAAADFSSAAQGFFNLATGVWTATSQYGTVSDAAYGQLNLGNGWWLIWITATIIGNRTIEFFPVETQGVQIPAIDKSLDVTAPQLEPGTLATNHKLTSGSITARSLQVVTTTLSVASIGVGQTTTATAELLDTAGAPWDQYGPVTFNTSDATKAGVSNNSLAKTDRSGRIISTVTGVALGTANITSTANAITSTAKTVTVSGTAIARFIHIFIRPEYINTFNWYVGVYTVHGSDRFPTTKLFEASGQRTENVLHSNGGAWMIVAVPSGVSLSAGQYVDCVIENDNVGGKAVDGPGIFQAIVV